VEAPGLIMWIPGDSRKAGPFVRTFTKNPVFASRRRRPVEQCRVLGDEYWTGTQRVRDFLCVSDGHARLCCLRESVGSRQACNCDQLHPNLVAYPPSPLLPRVRHHDSPLAKLRTFPDSVLCNQHHSEACFAFHHASVSMGGFMPRNARQSQTRIGALDSGRVGVANAASFHPNPNLTWTRLSGPALHYS